MRSMTHVFRVDDDLVTTSLYPLALAGSQPHVLLLDLDVTGTPLGTAGRAP